MKVLTVIENYKPFNIGGAEITIESYISFLTSNNLIEFNILTGSHTKVADYKREKNVIRILRGVEGESRPFFLIQIFNVLFNLLMFSFTVIFSRPNVIEFVPNNYSLFPLIYISIILHLPIIISIHSNTFSEKVPSIANWLDQVKKSIINYINEKSQIGIITISHFMKKELINVGFKSSRIAVLHNPILKMNPRSDHQNYAVYASRLVEEKGLEYVLKAFSKIPLDLHVFGDGKQRMMVELYSLKYPNIKYFGRVTEEKVTEAIEKCFCIVSHPLYEEPYGRYIVHSLTFLKPLISTYSGAVPEIIINRHNGLLIKKRDLSSLIAIVNELITNPSLYIRIVKNLEIERLNFLIERIAKERLNIYRDTI